MYTNNLNFKILVIRTDKLIQGKVIQKYKYIKLVRKLNIEIALSYPLIKYYGNIWSHFFQDIIIFNINIMHSVFY